MGMTLQGFLKNTFVVWAFRTWMCTQRFGIWGSQGVEVDDTKPAVVPGLSKTYTASEGGVILGSISGTRIVEYKE